MASDFLSVAFSWEAVVLLIIAWYFLLRYWENSGKLDEWNASRIFFGMVLMVRTSKGKSRSKKSPNQGNFGEPMERFLSGSAGEQC